MEPLQNQCVQQFIIKENRLPEVCRRLDFQEMAAQRASQQASPTSQRCLQATSQTSITSSTDFEEPFKLILNLEGSNPDISQYLKRFIEAELTTKENEGSQSTQSIYTTCLDDQVYQAKLKLVAAVCKSRSEFKHQEAPDTEEARESPCLSKLSDFPESPPEELQSACAEPLRPRLYSEQTTQKKFWVGAQLDPRASSQGQHMFVQFPRPTTSLSYVARQTNTQPESSPPAPAQSVTPPQGRRRGILPNSGNNSGRASTTEPQDHQKALKNLLAPFSDKYEKYCCKTAPKLPISCSAQQPSVGSPRCSAPNPSGRILIEVVLFIDFDDTIHPTSYKDLNKIVKVADVCTATLQDDFTYVDYQVVSHLPNFQSKLLIEAVEQPFHYVAIVTNSSMMDACLAGTMPLTRQTIKLLQMLRPTELGVFSARDHFSAKFPDTDPAKSNETKTKWKTLAFKFIAQMIGIGVRKQPVIVVLGDSDQEMNAGQALKKSCKGAILKTVKLPVRLCPLMMGRAIQSVRKQLGHLHQYNQSQEWTFQDCSS